jgi:hypothetical protein
MAKTITLRYDAYCTECGAFLPAGTRAKYYNRRHIYGLGCHARPQKARKNWRRDDPIHRAGAKPIEMQEGADGVWFVDQETGEVVHKGMEVPLWDKR